MCRVVTIMGSQPSSGGRVRSMLAWVLEDFIRSRSLWKNLTKGN